MTTKTKPKAEEAAPDVAVRREQALEKAIAEAQAEEDAVRDAMSQHRARIHGLKVRLTEASIDRPEDFGPTGIVKPDSPSGKVGAEIVELVEQDNYDTVLNGAIVRRERAEEALRAHQHNDARDLLLAMVPEAHEAAAAWRAWAAEGEQVHRRLVQISTRAARLVVNSRIYKGDARHVPDHAHQAHVLRLARQEPLLPLPKPLVDELAAQEGAESNGE